MTGFFDRGGDVVDAMARMSSEADVVWFDGHSDYGHAFEVFAQKWPDAVTPKTSLLVLGDARTNYRAPALPALRGDRAAGQARVLAQPRAAAVLGIGRLRGSGVRRGDADGRVPQRRAAPGSSSRGCFRSDRRPPMAGRSLPP